MPVGSSRDVPPCALWAASNCRRFFETKDLPIPLVEQNKNLPQNLEIYIWVIIMGHFGPWFPVKKYPEKPSEDQLSPPRLGALLRLLGSFFGASTRQESIVKGDTSNDCKPQPLGHLLLKLLPLLPNITDSLRMTGILVILPSGKLT